MAGFDFQGLIGGVNNALMSPAALAGLGLLSGEGMSGAAQGVAAGTQNLQAQEMQRQAAINKQRDEAFAALQPNDPRLGNLPSGVLSVAQMLGPDAGSRYMGEIQSAGIGRQQEFENQKKLREMQFSKPQFGPVGQNMYGMPVYGFINPATKSVSPVSMDAAASGLSGAFGGGGATTGGQTPGQGPTGDAYLQTLPKPMADQVKAIAEGRIPIPGGFALKTPYWQQMMTHVSQYDPSFDAVNYNARAKTRADFTAGKSAQNITSFNTAIGHLDTLDKSIDALGNTAYPTINAVNNASVQAGNTDRGAKLADFNAAKDAVSKELVKAFRGSGGSLTEIQGFENMLDSTKSPQELHAVSKQLMELLYSRIQAVGDQYNRGMGTTSDPVTLLSPKAQKIWTRLYGGEQQETPTGVPAGKPLADPKSKEEYDALPSGARYTDPNGTPRVKS